MSKSQDAKISPSVMKWVRDVVETSCPFEIKHTGSSKLFRMANLPQHQRDYLLAATTDNGFVYKLVDANINFLPCDCIFYKNSKAYVVIVYPQFTVAIEIRILLKIKTPSLFFTKAMELAEFTVLTDAL